MPFVIKSGGYYAKGRGFSEEPWTDDLQQARVFARKSDAKNSWAEGEEVVAVRIMEVSDHGRPFGEGVG